MAVAVGTIAITNANTLNGTTTVSGLAFQPAWIIFTWNGRGTAGVGEADHKCGVGIATGTTSRRAYATHSDSGPTNMAADSMWRNDSCILGLTIAGAVDGRIDLNAINSDGFQLIVDDAYASANLFVGYICGTADSVAIVDFTEPGATGNQDYNAGIDMTAGATDDKFVFFIGGPDGAVDVTRSYSLFGCGFAAGNTIAEACLAGNSQDGAATSLTNGYCRSGRSVGIVWDDQVRSRASLTTWLGTGFRLNWAETTAAHRFSALVVKGGNRYFVGDALTSTGTTNQTEGTPYQPTALLTISAARAASADDTATAHDTRIIGAATGAANRWCFATQDPDATANGDPWIDARTDAVYSNPDVAAAQAVEGLMDIVSFDSTPGFTYVMDDADPAQSFFAYLGFADTPGGGGATVYNRTPFLTHITDSPIFQSRVIN